MSWMLQNLVVRELIDQPIGESANQPAWCVDLSFFAMYPKE